ncbi:hypothetical protein LA20531_07090 [Lactobacillus amylovorus DSM 20531]|uniref:YobI family P-loop NTPase n=1 Tax=Lactobacillus amylovorus TaxID=1604 RepID=UPI0006F13787|nr:hypothetical protein [Lactobacillus amylovorus]ATO53398.1 hypothetical protein LA20531_07090 [Lactobacillus amylovorus DSM 20531]KRK41957.1 hypothetical protein FC63_GL001094 [Lactobacillus amylovorus DSM 20531]MCT3592074.1 hypothetical protein [Lactobacillus amylovorus]
MNSKLKYNDAINGALYPYDFLNREICKPEWDNLENALNDTRVTNIAISAPYDTGKTSFLLSFFTQKHMDYLKKESDIPVSEYELRKKARKDITENKTNFSFINLPNFFLKKEGKESEIELEKDIIGQLLFSSNPWYYPDSKIRRLKEYPFWSIGIAYILIATFISLGVALFNKKLNDLTDIFQYYNSLSNSAKTFVFLGLVLGFCIFYFCVHYFSKISWTLSSNFGNKIELSGQYKSDDPNVVNKDLLLLYGDELKYYFKKSRIKYVIFEDLDRYNQPLIFQRLRQLNINLNKGKQRIVFIYTLKDSVFNQRVTSANENIKSDENDDDGETDNGNAAELKSKFFDYIISLMPTTSFQNSKGRFKDEIRNYRILRRNDSEKSQSNNNDEIYDGKIDEKYLDGLGNFIYDTREIVSIISEVATYAQKLSDRNISIDKLLGVVVYKNEYPEDFENIINGTSKISCLMQNRFIFYEIDKEEATKQASNLKSLDTSKAEIEDKKYSEIIKNFLEKYPTTDDLVTVVEKTEDFKELDSQERHLLKQSIALVYDEKLIRYLLIEDLLDPTYCEYISSSAYTLSLSDRIFVQNVLSYHLYNKDQKLDNAEEVRKELDSAGANYKFAYSSDLIINLISSKDLISEIEDFIIPSEIAKILQTARKLDDIDIISNVIKKVEYFTNSKELLSIFIHSIMYAWPNFYKLIGDTSVNSDAYPNSQNIIEAILIYLSSNNDEEFKALLNKDSVLDLPAYVREINKLSLRKLSNIDYQFEDLTFIQGSSRALVSLVKKNNYQKNTKNFEIIMNQLLHTDFSELLKNKDIYHLDDEFIKDNIFSYYSSINQYKLTSLTELAKYFNKLLSDKHELQSYDVKILTLYSNKNVISSTSDISEFLNSINFVQLVNEKSIDSKFIKRLIEADKLIYSKEIFENLYADDKQIALEYAWKYENEDNISDFFYERLWKFIMDYLERSRYQTEIVDMIDNQENLNFTESDCSNESIKIMLNKTKNAKVIRHIMQFRSLSEDNRGLIINRIFSDLRFKQKFSREEVSQFIFNTPIFIKTWVFDGKHEVVNKELIDEYKDQFNLLYNNIPQSFKKKGTNKFIFLKKFKLWLI